MGVIRYELFSWEEFRAYIATTPLLFSTGSGVISVSSWLTFVGGLEVSPTGSDCAFSVFSVDGKLEQSAHRGTEQIWNEKYLLGFLARTRETKKAHDSLPSYC